MNYDLESKPLLIVEVFNRGLCEWPDVFTDQAEFLGGRK